MGGGGWPSDVGPGGECFFVSDVTGSVGSVNFRLETRATPARVTVKTQLQQQETINQIKHFCAFYFLCQRVPRYVLSTHILVLIFHPFVILSEDCYCSQLSPQVHIGSEEWRVERVTSLESAQSLSKCVLMRIAAYVRRPRI